MTTGPGSWEDATRLVRGGDLPAAADVLAAMGARAHEAWARELAAEQALEASPDVARMQLERATAFFREVGAAAALARVDTLAGALRPAAS